MAMQVKHMLTVGLGLGVATALGYHFLSSPPQTPSAQSVPHLMPLTHFDPAPAPPALPESSSIVRSSPMVGSTPVPTQPQVDNQFRSEATPLRAPTFKQEQISPNASYNELVSAAQANLPDTAKPAATAVSNEPDNSDDSFSLDLSSPKTSKEPEFVFEEQDPTWPQTVQQPTTSELNQSTEEFSPTADQVVIEEETFVNNSTQTISSEDQSTGLAVVVDYHSEPIDRSANDTKTAEKNVWKGNPFINNQPVATAPAKPTLPASNSAMELPAPATVGTPVTVDQDFDTSFDMTSIPPTSVLSLNDPAHEDLVRTMPATTIPNTIQPPQQPLLIDDQLANHTTPISQMPMNSADTLKAVHHIEYGKTLSRRGAAYTARQEFLSAMQLIAAANDKTSGDNRHSKALRMAMLTIKEAGDFSVASSEQQIQMDVASVVETHRSNVISKAQAANLSPVQAMNRYFARAQEQLDLAGGRSVVSAEVFYCMGKLHTLLSRTQKVLGPYETAESVVYHQAALLSDNQHHRSSNELGVLLARSGRLEQAKLLFERSLMAQPTVRTWQNLAEAHRRLGEVDYANQATNEVQMLASGQLPAAQSNIQWKPVNQFNADAPIEFNQQRVAELPPAPEKTPTPAAGKPTPAKSIADRIKGIF